MLQQLQYQDSEAISGVGMRYCILNALVASLATIHYSGDTRIR